MQDHPRVIRCDVHYNKLVRSMFLKGGYLQWHAVLVWRRCSTFGMCSWTSTTASLANQMALGRHVALEMQVAWLMGRGWPAL